MCVCCQRVFTHYYPIGVILNTPASDPFKDGATTSQGMRKPLAQKLSGTHIGPVNITYSRCGCLLRPTTRHGVGAGAAVRRLHWHRNKERSGDARMTWEESEKGSLQGRPESQRFCSRLSQWTLLCLTPWGGGKNKKI